MREPTSKARGKGTGKGGMWLPGTEGQNIWYPRSELWKTIGGVAWQ